MSMSASTLEARDLRLVRAIAETGGATRAAKQLHLSQSAISHQLRGLEERLGVLLFRRDGRKLVITAAGSRLVALSHQVLGALWQAELELKRNALTERPKLRVATQCYTAYHWLPNALKALRSEHPEVELSLMGDVLGDVTKALNEGEVDLALCVIPPKSGKFTSVRLFRDELVLAVPRGHWLATRKYVDGKDLKNETLIQTTLSAPERGRIQRLVFGHDAADVAGVLRVPVSEAVLELVEAGLGVSILANFTLGARATRGDVVPVRLTRQGIKRQWFGVFPHGSALAPPIRTLVGTLKALKPNAPAYRPRD
jgi:LysR family transcriptional regulator, regulator for metE and metH